MLTINGHTYRKHECPQCEGWHVKTVEDGEEYWDCVEDENFVDELVVNAHMSELFESIAAKHNLKTGDLSPDDHYRLHDIIARYIDNNK